MADAHEVLATIRADLPNLDAQVLVPTARQTERALDAGAAHLVFVLSVSERHNWGNVRRSPQESAQEYAGVLALAGAQTKMRLNVATAFDCPYDGLIDRHQVFALLDLMIPMAPAVEVALCDTTGRATPLHVRTLFTEAMARYPASVRWAFHGHDTYGLGAANILAAWDAGVRIFDASVAGLGGCPFAPGATGNVATEDAVWMFEGMGIKTGDQPRCAHRDRSANRSHPRRANRRAGAPRPHGAKGKRQEDRCLSGVMWRCDSFSGSIGRIALYGTIVGRRVISAIALFPRMCLNFTDTLFHGLGKNCRARTPVPRAWPQLPPLRQAIPATGAASRSQLGGL
jgi:hypothetical protein